MSVVIATRDDGAQLFRLSNGLARLESDAGCVELPLASILAHGEWDFTTPGVVKAGQPTLVKVGKEGYIHGYICVRPPCGPQYTEATFDSGKGTVSHDGTRIGKMRKNPNGTYSMTHTAVDGTKTKLTAEHSTRAEAALSVGLFHDVDTLHRETGDGPVKAALGDARESLATGSPGWAANALTRARDAAKADGDEGMASHIDHVRSVIASEDAVEPKPLRGKPSAGLTASGLNASDRGKVAAELLNNGSQLGNTPYENQLKKDIQAWTKAPEYPGKAMKEALDNAPGNAPTLYRGMRAGRGTVPYGQLGVMADAKPGDTIDMPASSWSSDAKIGTSIARGRGPLPDREYRRNVLLELEPGSHALNVEPHAGDYAYQREWATGGKLEVTRPPTADADGVVTVHVRQAKTLSGVDTTEEKPSAPQITPTPTPPAGLSGSPATSSESKTLEAPKSPAPKSPAPMPVPKAPMPVPKAPATPAEPSIADVMAQIRENWAPTVVQRDGKLTADEHKALSDYTHPEKAAAVNDSLRHGAKPDEESATIIRNMDSALAKSHAKDDLVTYRGMAMDPAHPFTVGDEFTDNGFTSTTIDKRWAADWAKKSAGITSGGKGSVKPASIKPGTVPVAIRVMIPKGASVTPGAQSAGEIIVNRGTRYRVTKISKTMVTVEPVSVTPDMTTPTPPKASTAPLSEDPPQWLQDANDENQRLSDLLDAERTADFSGFTPKGEEIRRQQQLLMMGDPWASDDNPNRNGAEGRAGSEGISRAIQGKALLLATGKRNRAHVAAEAGLTPEAADIEMTNEVKKAIAGRRVAIRVTNGALGKIIDDNAFKTQFETSRSAGLKNNDRRAALEETQFGYPKGLDPSLRPVYGYLDDGYDRPAGVGSKYLGDFNTDRLSSFGTTQVVFKDTVKQRTTFNIGDSMDDQYSSLPSRLSDPQPRSFAAYGKSDGGLATSRVLRGINRDYSSSEFHGGAFIEAQIHSPGGEARPLTADDIDHVVFSATPPASLRQKLDSKGIQWQVKNAKTIAKAGTPEEKTRALAEYQGGLARANEKLQFYQRLDASQIAAGRPGGNWDEDITAVSKIKTQLEDNIAALQTQTATIGSQTATAGDEDEDL